MSFVLQPWQLVVVALAGWINQQQQEVIEYPNGQKARPSIKAFGNADLSSATCRMVKILSRRVSIKAG